MKGGELHTMRPQFIFNHPDLKEVRTYLRQKQTSAEEILWNHLRDNKTGFKWYRQYSVGKFVVDFYCPKRKLAIELDGNIHKTKDHPIYDRNRTEYLKLHRVNVKRFWNWEIIKYKGNLKLLLG